MDPSTPTEEERARLLKLHMTARRRRRNGRLFVLGNILFLVYTVMFGAPSLYVLALYVLVLLYTIYQSLVAPLLTQCPRCRRRMTVLKGRCTGCGVELSFAAATQRGLTLSLSAQSSGGDA